MVSSLGISGYSMQIRASITIGTGAACLIIPYFSGKKSSSRILQKPGQLKLTYCNKYLGNS